MSGELTTLFLISVCVSCDLLVKYNNYFKGLGTLQVVI